MVTKQKGKDIVVSYRLDEDVVKLFDCYVYSKCVSKKKALETIITEYLDGRERYELCGIQAGEIIADVMERVESAEGFSACRQAWDVGNALKYILRAGRKDALDIELGKAENYLHHALTGEWLGK